MRAARQTNDTYYQLEEIPASVQPRGGNVVAQGGATDCGGRTDGDSVSLLLEMLVDSKDILSADTMIRADHRSTIRKYLYFCYYATKILIIYIYITFIWH